MVERKLQPNPVVKSTEGAATRPSSIDKTKFCRLRFVNNFTYPIEIYWLDHDGKEKFYNTISVGGQLPQATYTTHAWRIREAGNQRLLGTYVGEEATIEMTPAAACIVHKGFSSGYKLSRKMDPSHWGIFRQRGEARGIAIRAFDCVSDKAVGRAEHIITKMVELMPKAMLNRMHQNAVDVAIIGRDQVTCDMPMHSYLKGKTLAQESPPRNFDCGTRGVGGSWTVPTCSAGEENLTMEDDRHYPAENILVHEFAHSVMAIGMNENQRQAVLGAYFNARANQLYRKDAYILASADEYWAEGAQSWFEATIRKDVNDGVNTRNKLKKHDSQLANLLEKAFGDGEWMYQQTSPAPLTHYQTPRDQGFQKADLLRVQARAARYSTCCLPQTLCQVWYNFGFWNGDRKSVEKVT